MTKCSGGPYEHFPPVLTREEWKFFVSEREQLTGDDVSNKGSLALDFLRGQVVSVQVPR